VTFADLVPASIRAHVTDEALAAAELELELPVVPDVGEGSPREHAASDEQPLVPLPNAGVCDTPNYCTAVECSRRCKGRTDYDPRTVSS
jgi:hypothetical protein